MALVSRERPDLFFMEQLEAVLAAERVRISQDAHVYLAGVLVRPASHDELAAHRLVDELATRFIAAVASGDAALCREVGDQALLLRGFWWQHVERPYAHGPSQTYYEDVGRRSYLSARTALCDELADRFTELCRVLALLWSHTALRTQDDLVTLYRFWLHTRSAYARAILTRHGIPVGLPQSPS